MRRSHCRHGERNADAPELYRVATRPASISTDARRMHHAFHAQAGALVGVSLRSWPDGSEGSRKPEVPSLQVFHFDANSSIHTACDADRDQTVAWNSSSAGNHGIVFVGASSKERSENQLTTKGRLGKRSNNMSYAQHIASDSIRRSSVMDTEDTNVAIQGCLNRLARATEDSDARQIVLELVSVGAGRILLLCGSTLSRRYPRLANGPFNVQPDDLLGAVVERLIKAMRNVRPLHAREFFALAMKHIRWELNGLVRELDAQRHEPLPSDVTARDPEASDERFSPLGHRILQAIHGLAQSDQEIFNLVRLHGMTQRDAADVLGISERTVERRLKRILPRLRGELGGVQLPQGPEPERKRMPASFLTTAAATDQSFPRHAA